MPVFVALSTVADGNMYIPESQADEQVIATRMAWLKKQGIEATNTTRVNISFDQDNYCRFLIKIIIVGIELLNLQIKVRGCLMVMMSQPMP